MKVEVGSYGLIANEEAEACFIPPLEHAQALVVRPEVMAPLAYTVRFIHSYPVLQ